MGGGVRGDAAREEAAGRTACGAVGDGKKFGQVSTDNKVAGQHKPRRIKSLMGVGGGSTAGAWVTYIYIYTGAGMCVVGFETGRTGLGYPAE